MRRTRACGQRASARGQRTGALVAILATVGDHAGVTRMGLPLLLAFTHAVLLQMTLYIPLLGGPFYSR